MVGTVVSLPTDRFLGIYVNDHRAALAAGV